MKLLRWAVAGASVYAVYRYSIGNKAVGEDVLKPQDKAIADLSKGAAEARKDEPATDEPTKA